MKKDKPDVAVELEKYLELPDSVIKSILKRGLKPSFVKGYEVSELIAMPRADGMSQKWLIKLTRSFGGFMGEEHGRKR